MGEQLEVDVGGSTPTVLTHRGRGGIEQCVDLPL